MIVINKARLNLLAKAAMQCNAGMSLLQADDELNTKEVALSIVLPEKNLENN